MSINKEKVNELLDGFDEINPEHLTNIIMLIHYVYRELSCRGDLIEIGKKIIKKLTEIKEVSIEESTVTAENIKVKDMLDFIKKEIKESDVICK